MAEKRDYYEVLGVDKKASLDEIKSAYKKAALKWHPDRHVGDSDADKKAAEEKFKEASEAYSVLSDENKRAKYDQFGFAGVDGSAGFGGAGGFEGGFGDINDVLRDLFGGAFGSFFGGGGGFGGGFGGFGGSGGGSARMRGRDIRTRVRLTLEEMARGCTKEVEIEHNRPCRECSGVGAKNASDVKTCPTCGGRGQVEQRMRGIFGISIGYAVCPQCGGRGKIVTNPCPKCKGTGLERIREKVKVTIPAGVENGMQLSVRGEGHSAGKDGINGDLLVVIEELPHNALKREGQNLFYTRVISLPDAVTGCEIEVPALDGPQKLKIEAGTQSGTVIVLRGKGMPVVNSYGKGNLDVKIHVWIPRKLDREQKKFFENLKESGAMKPDPNRDDRALFEKESQYF